MFGKIFEAVMKAQMINFFDRNKSVCDGSAWIKETSLDCDRSYFGDIRDPGDHSKPTMCNFIKAVHVVPHTECVTCPSYLESGSQSVSLGKLCKELDYLQSYPENIWICLYKLK